MRNPEHGDKVYLGDRKGALRVIGFTNLRGERAVELAAQGDVQGIAAVLKLKPGRSALCVLPIADLVRDPVARGWRERWRQQDLFHPKEG